MRIPKRGPKRGPKPDPKRDLRPNVRRQPRAAKTMTDRAAPGGADAETARRDYAAERTDSAPPGWRNDKHSEAAAAADAVARPTQRLRVLQQAADMERKHMEKYPLNAALGGMNVSRRPMPAPSRLPTLRWSSIDRMSYLDRLLSMFGARRGRK
jgi:hypothetical protein